MEPTVVVVTGGEEAPAEETPHEEAPEAGELTTLVAGAALAEAEQVAEEVIELEAETVDLSVRLGELEERLLSLEGTVGGLIVAAIDDATEEAPLEEAVEPEVLTIIPEKKHWLENFPRWFF